MSTVTLNARLDENSILTCSGDPGWSSEHNSSVLSIGLNEEFADGGWDYLRLAFDTGRPGGSSFSNEIRDDSSSPVSRSGDAVICPLPQSLTSTGRLMVQLIACRTEDGEVKQIKKSSVLSLCFRPSIAVREGETDFSASLLERINASLNLVSVLSQDVAALRAQVGRSILAGNYLNLTNSVMSVNASDNIALGDECLATCAGVREYTGEAVSSMLDSKSGYLTALVAASLVSGNEKCLGIYSGSPDRIRVSLFASGIMLRMESNDEYWDKHFYVVPDSDAAGFFLAEEYRDIRAGKIYRVRMDEEEYLPVVDVLDPSDLFAERGDAA